jgi:hypothetical protein
MIAISHLAPTLHGIEQGSAEEVVPEPTAFRSIPSVKAPDVLSHLKPLGNAHLLDREADRVRVTHPFHPLFDRELEIVDRRHFQDEEYVYVDIGNGEVARLPDVWTSLGPADPFIAISAGRSIFLVKDLVRLSRLVADLLRESQAPDRNGGEDVM